MKKILLSAGLVMLCAGAFAQERSSDYLSFLTADERVKLALWFGANFSKER